jgi:hypothetical protein
VLTQRLVLTSGGTSNVLRRLAAANLTERDPDPSDAGSSWVRLSATGVKMAEEVVRAASAAQAAALRDVPTAHDPRRHRRPPGDPDRSGRHGGLTRTGATTDQLPRRQTAHP